MEDVMTKKSCYADEVRTHYTHFYGEHGSRFERVRYYVDRFLFPEDVHGCTILDIGGGNGEVGLYLALFRGAAICVLDEYAGHGADKRNYDLIMSFKNSANVEGIRIEVGDVRRVEFAEKQFDYIYARNCLHHIYRRSDLDSGIVALFQKILLWLKPGGSFRIGEMGWFNVWALIPYLRNSFFPNVSFAPKNSAFRWARCAVKAGFTVEKKYWYVPRRLGKFRKLLANPIANTFLVSSYILHFKKPF